MQIVAQTKRRSGWPAHRTLAALGVPRSVYYGWRRRECLQDRPGVPCRVYEVLPEERAAICRFALLYPKIGYRKLTWMMIDAGIACVGESTVYRVLSEADLLSRWKRSERSSGEYHFRPAAPNQQWHTDVMYGAPSLWRRSDGRCRSLSMSGMHLELNTEVTEQVPAFCCEKA